MFPVKAMVCICGQKPTIDHTFTNGAWQVRVNCKSCGISAGNSNESQAAIVIWNRIQCALFAREMAQ